MFAILCSILVFDSVCQQAVKVDQKSWGLLIFLFKILDPTLENIDKYFKAGDTSPNYFCCPNPL